MSQEAFMSPPKQRVLHIMSGFGGGISSFIYHLAHEIPPHHIIFDVATYDECPAYFIDMIEAGAGHVYHLNNPKKEGWKAFETSLEEILTLHSYDVVHCHVAGYRALAYYYVCKKHGIQRFYIHAHTAGDPTKRSLTFYMDQMINRRLSAAYLGCGNLAIEALFGKVTEEEKVIIPNSIDLSRYPEDAESFKKQRNNMRKKLNLSQDTLVLGQIGRLEKVKNHALTLKIAQVLKDCGKDFHILIAGAGSLEEALRHEIKQLGLESHVHLLGRLSPIEDLYPTLDAVLLPSYYEGFPTVALEAQASGRPIFVSDRVTKEIDLKLGLVHVCSLGDEPAEWVRQILGYVDSCRLDFSHIHTVLQENHMTNQTAAQRYADFIHQDKGLNYD